MLQRCCVMCDVVRCDVLLAVSGHACTVLYEYSVTLLWREGTEPSLHS